MNKNSALVLQVIAIVVVLIAVVTPAVFMFIQTDIGAQHHQVAFDSSGVLMRTVCWSLSVGVLATVIGWPVGLRIATLKHTSFVCVTITLLMSLALPAYAVFYAWWQAWPAGSAFHQYVVHHGLLSFAMKTCALAALVGWSWPIPALIAALSTRGRNGLALLHRIDGASLLKRCINQVQLEKKLLFVSVVLVSAITAGNTTCFDLAQVSTVGNELRAILATGGSIFNAPWLSISGVIVAVIASFVLFSCNRQHQIQTIQLQKSMVPIVLVWVLLTGGPIVLSALSSLLRGGFQLWAQYGGDVLTSATIALSVAAMTSLIVVASMSLHVSTSTKLRQLATCLDVVWIIAACLPASLIAFAVGQTWHVANLEFIDRTPIVLILAQVARIGFVGALAGRWISRCPRTAILCQLDSPRSICSLFQATRPRLLQAIVAAIAISIAMSFGEVAMTSQLSPPSTNQPISIALLNAMHYQRPQIVTSALFVIVSIAVVGGICLYLLQKRVIAFVLLACVLISCQVHDDQPILNAVLIGSVGNTDGHFMTPRAIDADDSVIVVIDKTGRLQRFTLEGTFLSSWELELSGTGFPTGVSIDDEGNIWVADTHQHRILVLDSDGNNVLTFGEYGTDNGQFLYPTDIAFGVNGEVYVSEYGGNDRISVFNRAGLFIRTIGHHGESRNGFRRPQSIAVDPTSGNLYVADSGNHRIVVLDSEGEVVHIISEVGRLQSQLLYPYGILIDSPDSFLVCEFGNNRLQRFSMDGNPIGIWGSAGSEIGLLRTPWGIATTPEGVVVADTGNNRLQLMPDMMSVQ